MDIYPPTYKSEVNIEKLEFFFAILKILKNSPKYLERLVEYKLERKNSQFFFG
jgi:hypothetical protein